MAGTRFCITVVALVELIIALAVSIHVGFCQRGGGGSSTSGSGRRRSSHSVSKSLIPPVPIVVGGGSSDKDNNYGGAFEYSDSVLCPWSYLDALWMDNNDDGAKGTTHQTNASQVEEAGAAATSSFSQPRLDLRVKFVLEHVNGDDDSSDSTTGRRSLARTIVSSEAWSPPSYLSGLESLSISSTSPPLDVLHVDQPLLTLDQNDDAAAAAAQEPTTEQIKTIWKYVGEFTDAVGEQHDNVSSSLVVVYIPSTVRASIAQEEGKTEVTETVSQQTKKAMPDLAPTRSFQVDTVDAQTLSSWVLIPSLTSRTDDDNIQEDLLLDEIGTFLDSWAIESVVVRFGKQSSAATSTSSSQLEAFWQVVHDLWKVQTLNIYRLMDHDDDDNSLASLYPILTQNQKQEEARDIASLKSDIAKWQDAYDLLVVERRKKVASAVQRPNDALGSSSSSSPTFRFVPDFPIEHYAAILLPLIFPLLLPFLVSSIKEYKRLKDKKKDQQGKDDEPEMAQEEETT